MEADNTDELVRIARSQGRAEAYRDIAADARRAGAIDFAVALEREAVSIERAIVGAALILLPELDAEAYDPIDPKSPGYHDRMADLEDRDE